MTTEAIVLSPPYRFRFLWLKVALLFAMVIASILMAYSLLTRDEQSRFNISGEIIKKNELVAKLSADLIRKQLSKISVVGKSKTQDPEFIRLVEQGNWQGAVESAKPLIGAFDNGIFRIFITDPSGLLKADSPHYKELVGQNFAFRDWYQGVTTTSQPYISEVYPRLAKPEFNVVSYAFPIERLDSTLIGILVLQIKLDLFYSWVKDLAITPNTETFIVDQVGQVVAHPKIAPQGEIENFSLRPDVQKVLSGESGSEVIFDGKEYVSSYYALEDSGWGVVVRVPVEEL